MANRTRSAPAPHAPLRARAACVLAALVAAGCAGGRPDPRPTPDEGTPADAVDVPGGPDVADADAPPDPGNADASPDGGGTVDAPDPVGADDGPGPVAQDILSTDILLDLGALAGRAAVVVRPARGADAVTLDVHGLTLQSVAVDGTAVEAPVTDGIARVPVAPGDGPVTIEVAYAFPKRTLTQFDGWMPTRGATFLWPGHYGNLFPCNPLPEDGVTFTMEVTGFDPSLTALYPRTTFTDAPSYMPAVAVGDYVKVDLGTTTAGTSLAAWYLPGSGVGEATARKGTAHLVALFDFLERTYGPYAFGPESGSVEVDWGADSYGGMEHHPFVHVGAYDFGEEEVHGHEAAHAWFGDGVRIACWEDFVLSEGTTTYLTAHGLERVGGPDVWPIYLEGLDALCTGAEVNAVVLPGTCNAIDFEASDLWSLAPYYKGACFLEDVADLLGPDVLDEVLGDFYRARVNRAARMRDLVDAIEQRAAPADRDAIEAFVADWLLSLECPADYRERCGTHVAR